MGPFRVQLMLIRDSPLSNYFIEYSQFLLNTHPKRYARRRIDVLQEFLDTISCTTPDEVYLSDREKYLRSLRAKGFTPSHISWRLYKMCAFWNWMKRKNYATYNPFRALKRTI